MRRPGTRYRALKEISERRLYREQGFGTFEDYCRERWGWTRFTGYQYIRAAEAAKNVESTQQTPSLTQAFQLSNLTPEQQRDIAERVDFANTNSVPLMAHDLRTAGPPPPVKGFLEASAGG